MQISFPTGKIKIGDVEYIFDEAMTLVPSSQLTPTSNEKIVEPSKLQGTVVKTLTLKPYKVDFETAIKKGKYDYVNENIDDFKVDIDIPETKIELVKFDTNVSLEDVIAWGKENNKKLIGTEHLLALGIQFPDEQRENYIVGGSVRRGDVLVLNGHTGRRVLSCSSVRGDWFRDSLFGFLSSPKENTLSQIIKDLKFDYVNSNITETNFPKQELGKNYKVFHFGKTMTTEEVISEMNKESYQPANLYDLLEYVKEWNNNDFVSALGFVWQDSDGSRHSPFLSGDGSGRNLCLLWIGYDWSGVCRFLAVSK